MAERVRLAKELRSKGLCPLYGNEEVKLVAAALGEQCLHTTGSGCGLVAWVPPLVQRTVGVLFLYFRDATNEELVWMVRRANNATDTEQVMFLLDDDRAPHALIKAWVQEYNAQQCRQ